MGDFDIQEVEKMAEQTMLGIRHEITITHKVMTSLTFLEVRNIQIFANTSHVSRINLRI